MKGVVIKNTGSWYVVRHDDGTQSQCKIKGNLRLKGFRSTNPVAVGDVVCVEPLADGTAWITAIEPRRNYIIRRASNLSKEHQIIASNLDQAVLVVSLCNPMTNTTFIDRFLATAMAYRVPAAVVINKVDLLDDAEGHELLEAVAGLYRHIGYPVYCTSTVTGAGIDELRLSLADKTSLFSGNSGVGKSSLINQLVPDAGLRVGDVSEAHHTGMHTTTFSELLDLPGGGCLIDTPGVKGFGTLEFEKSEVTHYFPEIFEQSKSCRFDNCTHTHEPGCAVRDAVERSLISQSRYASYLSIIADDSDDKYRKPF